VSGEEKRGVAVYDPHSDQTPPASSLHHGARVLHLCRPQAANLFAPFLRSARVFLGLVSHVLALATRGDTLSSTLAIPPRKRVRRVDTLWKLDELLFRYASVDTDNVISGDSEGVVRGNYYSTSNLC
jgi:hypothetical protein